MSGFRYPKDVQPVELRLFGDLPAGVTAHVYCQNCGRISALDPALVAREWLDRPIYDVRVRSRCSVCKKKEATILLYDATRRSERAWIPHAPLPRN